MKTTAQISEKKQILGLAALLGPAQVGFSSDGHVLVVTDKATSVIDTYTVGEDGLIDSHHMFASRGTTPFGFAVRGHELFVSDAFGGAADASTVSSYEVHDNRNLEAISPLVPATETPRAGWLSRAMAVMRSRPTPAAAPFRLIAYPRTAG